MSAEKVIGIDLDNTLICYDDLFFRAACEEKLIDPSSPKGKESVRDSIRLLPDGERKWTRLQAIVYGPSIADAMPFEGVDAFLNHCANFGLRIRIISHKTHSATLDGKTVDLRKSALEWLEMKGFFDLAALVPDDVHFELTRREKIERIRSVGCTHFIDDLAEVFNEISFPFQTAKLLFAPHGTPNPPPDSRVFSSSGRDRLFSFRQWTTLRHKHISGKFSGETSIESRKPSLD